MLSASVSPVESVATKRASWMSSSKRSSVNDSGPALSRYCRSAVLDSKVISSSPRSRSGTPKGRSMSNGYGT